MLSAAIAQSSAERMESMRVISWNAHNNLLFATRISINLAVGRITRSHVRLVFERDTNFKENLRTQNEHHMSHIIRHAVAF